MFTTLIAVIHKARTQQFLQQYEQVIPWNDNDQFGAIPRSAKFLEIEDKEGFQLWRIVVFTDKASQYIKDAQKLGYVMKPFKYDQESFKKELEKKNQLEIQINTHLNKLVQRSLYAFSELYIALIHLKVIRAFIDGVLRFGIPPRFCIAIVQPNKGQEKHLLAALNTTFEDEQFSGMFGASSQDKDTGSGGGAGLIGESEDFFSFVSITLSTPTVLK